MKRLAPILVTVALAVGVSSSALAKERRYTVKKRVVECAVPTDAVTGVVETPIVAPGPVMMLPPEPIAESTPAGADTRGVTRSTGAGIGESSTRSDVGTGRGGAGISRSGTLAPPAIRERQVITTVPATATRARIIPGTSTTGRIFVPEGTVTVIEPVIPRVTTNHGTLGSASSTPVGVAPGK